MNRGVNVCLVLFLAMSAGCHDPVLDPFRPDPTPLKIFTPPPESTTLYPEGRAIYQFLPDGKTTRRVLIETLKLAGEDDMVFLEVDKLDDVPVIDELKRAADRGSTVWVALDDFTPESRAPLKRLADDLAGAGVVVLLPGQLSPAPIFSRIQARSLYAGQRDGTSVAIALGASLTAEGLASNCPSLLDLDDVETTATFMGAAGGYGGNGAQIQRSPRVIDGPAFARNHVLSTIADAKTSLDLAAPTLADPAIESALAAAVARAVDVRLLVGLAADADRLKGAKVGEVRHANTLLPYLLAIDEKKVVLGSTPLDTVTLNEARTFSLAIPEAHIATAASHWFEDQWDLKP